MNILDDMIVIYTDGSCTNNGSSKAKAGIGVWVPNQPDKCISIPVDSKYNQTNQVAELLAIDEGLKLVDCEKTVNIYTDSRYAVNCINSWYLAWKTNNWKKADGKRPLNLDIIHSIMDRISELKFKGCTINVLYIKAHAGNTGNENADRLAVAASKQNLTAETTIENSLEESIESMNIGSNSVKDRIDKCIEELTSIRNLL